MLRRVNNGGGFGVVLARGDATAGSIAVVIRAPAAHTSAAHTSVADAAADAGDVLLSPMFAATGGYEWLPVAAGAAIPGWIERARGRDPDLWIVELDIPDAARFVAETLGDD